MPSSPGIAALETLPPPPSVPAPSLARDGVGDLDPPTPLEVASLATALGAVADPRHARGLRHDAVAVLVLAACAVLSGARSYVAIAEWAHSLGRSVLDHLGHHGPIPCESTIRRTLQGVDPAHLDAAIAGWVLARDPAWRTLAGITALPFAEQRRVIALDGKALRGSAPASTQEQASVAARGGGQVHLVAGHDHASGVVLGQVACQRAKGKGGEPAAGRALVADLAERGLMTAALVTADAGHTQRATAAAIVAAGGHYLLTVKGNQARLLARCKHLNWSGVAEGGRIHARARGRTETRTIKVLDLDPCPDGGGEFFPHAAQVIKVVRRRKKPRGRWSVETVYAITSLDYRAGQPELLAGWLRGHWGIENRLHWVRDVTFDEDRSRVRTGAGPRVMAALRNLAISALRHAGWTNIAAGLRQHARQPTLPLLTLGLT